MTNQTSISSLWFWAACLFLAAFVYLHNTGSQHAATNPDEYLYIQIARLTGETGDWLPLQATETRHRNTKPPGLFWQGMAATNFGDHWELWRLRLPNALYSVATAAMVFLIARRLAGGFTAGAVAALAYLAFLGVYRHGRVFLTSAPETFWLFMPFFVLLMLRNARITWPTALIFGLMLGVGLLYKSFAMIIPPAAALAWWTLRESGYRGTQWLRHDAPKIALICLTALAVFSLWFLLDPQRHVIMDDFVLKENVGKFDAAENGYLSTALWGKHSIWQYTAGWLTNAGLVAPAIVALFAVGWRKRDSVGSAEMLLWIWAISLFIFHLLPNLRYERYLLPAMPAIAVLCGLYWNRKPRWALVISIAAALVASLAMIAGAALLSYNLRPVQAYSATDWCALVAIGVVCAAGLVRRDWTHSLALPSVLLAYAAFTVFLRPFDGPIGKFPQAAIDAVEERVVTVPVRFTGRDELYRFLLPGADIQPIKHKHLSAAMETADQGVMVVPMALDAPQLSGYRVLGRRLNLVDYFTADQMRDMLRGRIARHLFCWDVLVEPEASATPQPAPGRD